jgi:hypothetical protein
LYDGKIILDPLRIVGLRNGVGGGVSVKIAVPKVKVEEVAPMIVVVRGEI